MDMDAPDPETPSLFPPGAAPHAPEAPVVSAAPPVAAPPAAAALEPDAPNDLDLAATLPKQVPRDSECENEDKPTCAPLSPRLLKKQKLHEAMRRALDGSDTSSEDQNVECRDRVPGDAIPKPCADADATLDDDLAPDLLPPPSAEEAPADGEQQAPTFDEDVCPPPPDAPVDGETPGAPAEAAFALARSTFERSALVGYDWAKERNLPFIIPGSNPEVKILYTKTWTWDPEPRCVVTARIKCPFHDKCNKTRTHTKEFTTPFKDVQIIGFLGAWLEKALDDTKKYTNKFQHMDAKDNPTLEEIEVYLKKNKLLAAA